MRRAAAILGMVGVVAGWSQAAWAQDKGEKEGVEVYVIDPRKAERPENSCKVEGCKALLRLIEGAKTQIDFAIYGMRNQAEVLQALREARQRGVIVRGVVDRDAEGKNYYSSTEALAAALGGVRSDWEVEKELAREGDRKRFEQRFDPDHKDKPQSCTRPEGFLGPLQCLGYDLGDRCLLAAHASEEDIENDGAIMHNKFFVVDGQTVWTGSTNLSDSGTGGYNANIVVVVRSRQVALWYTQEFNRMYVDNLYHGRKPPSGELRTVLKDKERTEVQVLFSPQDKPITQAVRPLLQKARKSIDIGIFFLTHKEITRDLLDAHRRGVKIRVILDATAARNGYTKHELLRAAGIPVKVEAWGGKMHMKAAVIDGRVLIGGSMNWTSAGEGGNDENTLILHSRSLAKTWTDAFNQLWGDIPDKWLEGRPDPESKDSAHSCTDGVDDDFDHLTDKEDPGCADNPPPLAPLPPWRIVPKEEGHNLIKVKGSADPDRRFYPPWHPDYADIVTSDYFCSEADAWAAGYKEARMGRGRR